MGKPTPEDRIAICKTRQSGSACEHYVNIPHRGFVCRLCGCMLAYKASLEKGKCPKGYW